MIVVIIVLSIFCVISLLANVGFYINLCKAKIEHDKNIELIKDNEYLSSQNKILSSDLILVGNKNRQLQDEIDKLKGVKK